jgi:predicted XRE-type DNA-binding protein
VLLKKRQKKHRKDGKTERGKHMRKLRKDGSDTEMAFEVGSGNIFQDLGFPDDEAENLHIRGLLAIEIGKIIKENGWTQRQAAKEMGIGQPRVAEVMKMRLDHYSVDLLLKYLDKLGRRVLLVVEKKAEVA